MNIYDGYNTEGHRLWCELLLTTKSLTKIKVTEIYLHHNNMKIPFGISLYEDLGVFIIRIPIVDGVSQFRFHTSFFVKLNDYGLFEEYDKRNSIFIDKKCFRLKNVCGDIFNINKDCLKFVKLVNAFLLNCTKS